MDQLLGRQAGRIFNNEAWGCRRGWKVSGTDCVGDRKLLDPKSGLGAIGTRCFALHRLHKLPAACPLSPSPFDLSLFTVSGG
jgi:hypothetical protein